MNPINVLKKIPRSNKYSFYPEKERKSTARIFGENILWLIKHKEINHFYYVYGSDVKGNKVNDYLSYNSIRKMRDARNKPSSQFDYLGVLRDKFIFAQYLTSINMPTPQNYYLGDQQKITELSTVPNDEEIQCFCKDLTGFGGEDVFPITLKNQRILIDGEEKEMSWLQSHMKDKFIIQQRIDQHEDLSRLYPNSINTIRILTVHTKLGVRIASAIMRIGANGSSTDNWASGGLIVKVDMATGKLNKFGYFKKVKNGKLTVHPNSGENFEGFKIPYYEESCKLVLDLHRFFYGIHSIGWDVAITPEGPMILEGNDNWDIAMQQKFYKKETAEIFAEEKLE